MLTIRKLTIGVLVAVSVMHARVDADNVDYSAEERKRNYVPTEANQKARQWFQDAKFGMFIHWGVYSVLGKGEWVMQYDKMTVDDYEKLPPQFNPTRYDPESWVMLAKQAGMKYITITSKHHDGFAMFDSKVSDYDIVDRTPYQKDVLKMLADACAKHGLQLFFYYSQLDWHHPDYYPRGRTGHHTGREESGQWYRYLDYMDAQLTELCSNYGPIAGIWFDGWWDRQKFPETDWRLYKTYKLIHDLQPQALIGSNHHVDPFPGEDIQTWEKDLPGQNTAGGDRFASLSTLPLETCQTIGTAWGYKADEKKFKSVKELIQHLVRTAGHNANFLLNIGPKPDGTIRQEFVDRLKGIGQWMQQNGETIYGTRGGPFAPRPWGVSTQKGNLAFVHILDWPADELALPPVDRKIASIKTYHGDIRVTFNQSKLGTLLNIPKQAKDNIDTILTVAFE